MKMRNGFVSNSSSSSFVIALETQPKDVKDLRFMLLLCGDKIQNECSETEIDTKIIVKRILTDIRKSTPITKWKEIYDVMRKGTCYNDVMPDSNDYKTWEKYDKCCIETEKILAKIFVRNNRKKKIYVLEYSDNKTTLEACIEHGNVFENVKHLHISHH